MADDFVEPNRPPAPSRQPPHGERLFEFLRGPDRYLCELRDHGETYGVEAQLWKNEELFYSRGFDPRLNRTRTPRELALAWANAERKHLETGGV